MGTCAGRWTETAFPFAGNGRSLWEAGPGLYRIMVDQPVVSVGAAV